MIGYLTGWAAAGFGVRVYQLAIMKRNIFDNLGGHLISMGAFTGIGYYAHQAGLNSEVAIQAKKEQLLRMREREQSLAGQEETSHH